jgi:hypothetical protein
MEIVGLAGHARVGKTTLANWIAETYKFTHLSFGGVLREITAARYNIDISHLIDDTIKDKKFKDFGLTPREMMISTANNERKADELFFAKHVSAKISEGGQYVISDFGFKSDLDYFKDKYGSEFACLWIDRPIELIFDNRDIVKEDCEIVIYGKETEFDPKYMIDQMNK